jgi:16S rRNA (guanine527-N7)-methyltransferase
LNSELVSLYFPQLTAVQLRQFEQLGPLYEEWNAKINVVSRKDIDNLYERHVLHSLAIGKVIEFAPGTMILDAGTGGGFPGLPLAILFPEAGFHLVDSTNKKLSVVGEIATVLGLKNITLEHCRLEDHRGLYDFVVSRAVASLIEMAHWVRKNIKKDGINELPNGILYLKGGDVQTELQNFEKSQKHPILKPANHQNPQSTIHPILKSYSIYQLSKFFTEEFFQTKKLIHLY